MANKKTHRVVGTLTGAGAAAIMAKDQGAARQLVEMLGGVLGGLAGGSLPDILEPARHPNHRQFGHSVSAGVAIATATAKGVKAIQAKMRAEADIQLKLNECSEGGEAMFHSLAAFMCLLLSGMASGLPTGYLTHLMLDAGTPKGLPLLGMG